MTSWFADLAWFYISTNSWIFINLKTLKYQSSSSSFGSSCSRFPTSSFSPCSFPSSQSLIAVFCTLALPIPLALIETGRCMIGKTHPSHSDYGPVQWSKCARKCAHFPKSPSKAFSLMNLDIAWWILGNWSLFLKDCWTRSSNFLLLRSSYAMPFLMRFCRSCLRFCFIFMVFFCLTFW